MKPFKTLNEQIEHLKQNKQVVVPFGIRAKQDLYDGNYYNVVSCSKIKFAENVVEKNHVYSKTQFKEWLAYFQLDCQISKYLMQNMIDFERKINSRIAYRISELLENGSLTDYEKNEIHQLIGNSSTWRGNFNYHGKEAWTYITKMTFGEMKQLIFWLLKNKPEIYDEVVVGLSFINRSPKNKDNKIIAKFNELNNLRNCLFHFTPLTIYITYGKAKKGKLKNNARKQVIHWVLKLRKCPEIEMFLTEMFDCSDNFIALKNSQQIAD